jgi:hypothetical protein
MTPSGMGHSVAQAISKNPFMIIVPCHRVLEAGGYADRISANGGSIATGCCRSKAPAAAAARRRSTCCFPLLRRARRAKIAA